MSLKITTLIENTGGEHLGLKTEHGLSFFIEKDETTLLFDTGQTDAILYNASQLNINLSEIDYVVLSHGHYDHSGGLIPLCEKTDNFEIVLGRGFFNRKFGFRNNAYEYLGNNFTETELQERNLKYRFIDQAVTELGDGIYVLTNFPRTNISEVVNSRFKLETVGGFIPDKFEDEILIAVDTPEGMVVIIGCSHPGIRNMLDAVRNHFNRPIHAVLGGTHLVEAKGENLELSINYLSDVEIKLLGVSHCTGKEAMSKLECLSGSYFHNCTGRSIYLNF